jgi:hypothetical protein
MRLIDADAFIAKCGHWYTEEGDAETGYIGELKYLIEKQPTIQPEPHWIPCSEELPETTDAVLTTYIVNGDRSRRYVEESSYYGDDESWSSPWDEYRIAGTRIEVVAWMPLPEPFKGVTE